MSGLIAMPVFALAFDSITLRENEVIPIKFDSAIYAKSSHRGDRFTATVDNFRDLPEGTRLRGVIREIQKADGGERKAYADLDFTAIEFPNGETIPIDALPVPTTDRYVTRDRNGHMEAKKATRRDHVVIGGTVGGLILGSLLKKPFEGAMIGALAGILVAETDGFNTSGQLIVEKGQKMGAAFSRETVLEWGNDRTNRTETKPSDEQNSRLLVVSFDGHDIRFDKENQPFRDGSTVMVALPDMAEELSLQVSRTSEGVYFLEDQDNTLKVEQNSEVARLNGKRLILPKSVIQRDGVLYIPLEAFAALKRQAFYVNGTKIEVSS